tara:strand:+ start:1343 stop:1654 length:312 start_codon:yes stop_codon:yes gene_type:complete
MGYPNEIERRLLGMRLWFCPQSPRLDSGRILYYLMGKLFETENVRLMEEGFGQLYLYFKDTTVEFHENFDYDVAVPLGHLPHEELEGIAKAILAWLEPNDSIE